MTSVRWWNDDAELSNGDIALLLLVALVLGVLWTLGAQALFG